jgi:hypothetical protein
MHKPNIKHVFQTVSYSVTGHLVPCLFLTKVLRKKLCYALGPLVTVFQYFLHSSVEMSARNRVGAMMLTFRNTLSKIEQEL